MPWRIPSERLDLRRRHAPAGWHRLCQPVRGRRMARLAFIGSETKSAPSVEVVPSGPGPVALFIQPLGGACRISTVTASRRGLPVDEHAAVIVDLDKTALGARGRNGHVIDRARLQAVQDTLARPAGCSLRYGRLPGCLRAAQPARIPPIHRRQPGLPGVHLPDPGRRVCTARDELMAEVRSGQLTSFDQFIAGVERTQGRPAGRAGRRSTPRFTPTSSVATQRRSKLSGVTNTFPRSAALAVQMISHRWRSCWRTRLSSPRKCAPSPWPGGSAERCSLVCPISRTKLPYPPRSWLHWGICRCTVPRRTPSVNETIGVC